MSIAAVEAVEERARNFNSATLSTPTFLNALTIRIAFERSSIGSPGSRKNQSSIDVSMARKGLPHTALGRSLFLATARSWMSSPVSEDDDAAELMLEVLANLLRFPLFALPFASVEDLIVDVPCADSLGSG